MNEQEWDYVTLLKILKYPSILKKNHMFYKINNYLVIQCTILSIIQYEDFARETKKCDKLPKLKNTISDVLWD